MLKTRRFSLLFLIWITIITLLSLVSFGGHGDGLFFGYKHIDKIVHFIFYFGFVLFASFSFKEIWVNNSIKKALPKIVVVTIGYSILIEFVQDIMPTHRTAEFYDVLANSLGAILAGLLVVKYHSLIRWLK